MNTYKFSFTTFDPNTEYLQNKGWKDWYLKKWLSSYALDYDIPDRERMEDYVRGYGKFRTYFKKPVKIDWRETIFNLKVIKIKERNHWFKVTFKCKLTPKEAYIIGKALEEGLRNFYNVTYKITKQG